MSKVKPSAAQKPGKPIRVTKRYLTKWIDDKMQELEIDLHVSDITHTRLRGHEYEGGAAVYIVTLRPHNGNMCSNVYFYIHYHMGQLQDYLNSGYKLFFSPKNVYAISGAEIDVRR